MRKKILFLAGMMACCSLAGAQEISKTWVADKGNGTYQNPVLHADYSDPDVCAAGDDFYMTASSFNCIPGIPILHSNDLVNWSLVNYALPVQEPEEFFDKAQHGKGVWAPAIRFHNGEFYIYWGDPDYGIYMIKTKDPKGKWSKPVLVKAGKGMIDATPLWDEDGKVYLIHAYAGSRSGVNSILVICELNAEGTEVISDPVMVFDGNDGKNHTVEGPKLYKRNGYYYIFAPAGGVATGWQLVLRSKNIYGPYESKIVMAQGKTNINGPHQGGWVDTPTGEDWFMHFQDVGAYGRLVHLQPMKWVDDWPVIGVDKDGDGCGEPVLTYKKPNVGKNYPICTPQESDEFDGYTLSPQWQWQANINEKWAYFNGGEGFVRLYSYPVPEDYKSLWDVSNLMLQKTPAPNFTATTKLTFKPTEKYKGERTGLVVMGMDYAGLVVENTDNGLVLSQVECLKADRGATEKVNASVPLKDGTIYLRAKFSAKGDKIKASEGGHDLLVKCNLSYSTDGKKFQPLGETFQVKEGKWIGAKVGIFCTRPAIVTNDGGWTDADWFRIEK